MLRDIINLTPLLDVILLLLFAFMIRVDTLQNNEMKDLAADLQSKTNRISVLEQEAEQLRQDRQNLNQELDTAVQEKGAEEMSLRQYLGRVQADKQQALQALAEKERLIEETNQALASERKNRQALQTKLADLEKERSAIQHALTIKEKELKDTNQSLASERQALKKIRQDLSRQESLAASLGEDLAAAAKQREALQQNLVQKEKEIKSLNNRLAENEKSLTDLRTARADLDQKHQQLTRELDQKEKDYQATVRDLEASRQERDDLAAANSRLTGQISGLNRDLADKEKEIQDKAQQVQALRSRETELSRQLAAAADARLTLARNNEKLKKDLDQTQAALDDSRSQVRTNQSLIAELKKVEKDLRIRSIELIKRTKEVGELREDKQRLTRERSNLDDQLKASNKKNADLEDRIRRLGDILDDSRSAQKAAERELKQNRDQISLLQKDLEKARADRDQTSARLAKLQDTLRENKQLEQHQSQAIAAQIKQLDDARQKIKVLDDTISALEKDKQVMATQLETTREALGQKELEVVRLQGMQMKNADEIRVGLLTGSAGGEGSVNLQINFEFNSHLLLAQGQVQADQLGKALTDKVFQGRNFLLIGHTDARGTESANQWLSQARAREVKKYLVQHFGMDPDRIRTEGMGESRPLVDGNTEYDYALNRRVEVKLDNRTQSQPVQ